MRKKILSLALALALCLGLMTVPAAAAGATLTEIVSEETYASFLEEYCYAIRGFHEGITWHGAPIAHHYGAFDATGKVIVVPGSYNEVRPFSDGAAFAQRGSTWCAVDNTGRELFTLEQNLQLASSGDEGDFHDGLAKVCSRETQKYGYVDKTGKVVIPFEHNISAGDFHDGLAVVYDAANAFYGYMDKTGKVVIPYQYAYVSDFVNGFAVVQLGSRRTIIDTTGKELLPQDYGFPSDLYLSALSVVSSSQVVLAYNRDSGYAFFNKAGQIVSGGYGRVYSYSNGMACVAKDGKFGFVNESGVLVIPCTLPYDGTFRDGYAAILTPSDSGDSTYSIIDKTGKVTGSCKYGTSPAGNGCFKICSRESGRDRYGLVDYTGREIVPCKYKAIGDFSGGVAWVQNFENKYGFVNTTGAEIVPCQYDEIRNTGETGVFEVERRVDGEVPTSILKASGWTEPSVATQPTTPEQPAKKLAKAADQNITIDGKAVAFQTYVLSGTNYVKLRDIAHVLNGTKASFSVGYDSKEKSISVDTGKAYQDTGTEMDTPFAGADKEFKRKNLTIIVNGSPVELDALSMKDDSGSGYTYFKLRDLGSALGFNVGYSSSQGVCLETDKPYVG